MSTEQNKLGTTPIGRLLISMSIPMMISFFIQALYNMVDSMFVARISENALTAVSIAFPLQQIITAIGVGTGVAVNCLKEFFGKEAGSMPDEEPEWSEMGKAEYGRTAAAEAPTDAEAAKA